MIGIPLMLLFLTNIGVALADIFRYVYFKVICFGCFRSRKRDDEETTGEAADADASKNGMFSCCFMWW
ncbi:hypothetical protein DPMN_107832 [Dreissena polymorpha]|uniref:Uncharacterized protein n=1 Tax=Dreissena polymorpha TaxID=45954 RepID=A0A9D4K7Q3_DREPO|nr:hypothetical protein DPMN_107832 [Dreissena polymorpha]